jgi:hypothetical protein
MGGGGGGSAGKVRITFEVMVSTAEGREKVRDMVEKVFKSEEGKRKGASNMLARGLRAHCDMYFSEEMHLLYQADSLMQQAEYMMKTVIMKQATGDASANQVGREREGLLQRALELYKRAAQFWGKSESEAEEIVQVRHLWNACSRFWKARALLLGVSLALTTAHHVQHVRKANRKRSAMLAAQQVAPTGQTKSPVNEAAGELLQSQCYEVVFAMLVRLSKAIGPMSFYAMPTKNVQGIKKILEYFPTPDIAAHTPKGQLPDKIEQEKGQSNLLLGYTEEEGRGLFHQLLEYVLQVCVV